MKRRTMENKTLDCNDIHTIESLIEEYENLVVALDKEIVKMNHIIERIEKVKEQHTKENTEQFFSINNEDENDISLGHLELQLLDTQKQRSIKQQLKENYQVRINTLKKVLVSMNQSKSQDNKRSLSTLVTHYEKEKQTLIRNFTNNLNMVQEKIDYCLKHIGSDRRHVKSDLRFIYNILNEQYSSYLDSIIVNPLGEDENFSFHQFISKIQERYPNISFQVEKIPEDSNYIIFLFIMLSICNSIRRDKKCEMKISNESSKIHISIEISDQWRESPDFSIVRECVSIINGELTIKSSENNTIQIVIHY